MIRLIHGDNVPALLQLAREGVSVDLAYLDPPFLTGELFRMKDGRVAFDDRWPDRWAYLRALRERLLLLRELLAPHGSVVVHVSPRSSHYVKVLGDELFGEDAFASEIIWRYRRWPTKTPNLQRMHDVLLRWCKDPSAEPRFNQAYEPLAPSTLATWGTKKQRAVTDATGRRVRSSTLDEDSRGVPMGDVWEMGVIAPVSKERTGYPTQKPEALLERIVSMFSNEGDTVLDPYAGSGTTLAVAARLGRRAIGSDASDVAIEIASRRLGIEIERAA